LFKKVNDGETLDLNDGETFDLTAVFLCSWCGICQALRNSAIIVIDEADYIQMPAAGCLAKSSAAANQAYCSCAALHPLPSLDGTHHSCTLQLRSQC
jgi:hypothetical protein